MSEDMSPEELAPLPGPETGVEDVAVLGEAPADQADGAEPADAAEQADESEPVDESPASDPGPSDDTDLTAAPADTDSGSRDPDPTGDGTSTDDVPASDAEDEDAAPEDRTVPEPDEDLEQIEAERAERLDPDNRPDGAEIDNTQREFDSEKGMFTDDEDYDSAPKKFPAAGEQGA